MNDKRYTMSINGKRVLDKKDSRKALKFTSREMREILPKMFKELSQNNVGDVIRIIRVE